MSEIRVDSIGNESNTGGPVLSGITTFSGQQYFIPPTGTTAERPSGCPPGSIRFNTDSAHLEYWNGLVWLEFEASSEELGQGTTGDAGTGTRAIIHMGYGPSNKNTINALNMANGGTATDFGNSTISARQQTSCASSIRALRAGGYSSGYEDTIDFVTISSTGDATDFGNLTQARGGSFGGLSNNTRSIFAGGYSGPRFNIIDYVTIAQTGNAVDFGDLTATKSAPGTGAASPVRGVFFGGYTPTQLNSIDYITISTLGNGQDFGNLTTTVRSGAGASNATRGLYMSGQRSPALSSNVIEFITIASTGNALDFGDLNAVSDMGASAASSIKVIHHEATSNTPISAVMIATTGNSTDFGDTSENAQQTSGCSNGHGGL